MSDSANDIGNVVLKISKAGFGSTKGQGYTAWEVYHQILPGSIGSGFPKLSSISVEQCNASIGDRCPEGISDSPD